MNEEHSKTPASSGGEQGGNDVVESIISQSGQSVNHEDETFGVKRHLIPPGLCQTIPPPENLQLGSS